MYIYILYICVCVCIIRHSINKCPHVLIHWTASILQCVIDSVNSTTFNWDCFNFACAMGVLGPAWYSTTTSMCMLFLTIHDTACIGHSLVIVHCVGQLQLLWAEQHESKTSLVQCSKETTDSIATRVASIIINLLSYQINMQLEPTHAMSNHM